MNDRSRQPSFDPKDYQLPQQDRVCGRLAEGQPCAIGPDGNGECRVHEICEPWFDGTQWHCTRSTAFGGRCSEGPVPDPQHPEQAATCPHQCPPCQPVRSLRSGRRLVSGLTATAALGICLIILGGSSGDLSQTVIGTTAVVSPGPLTAHHATMREGCSACHSAATQSPGDLLSCFFGDSGGIDESHRCLKCHEEFGAHALQPHSISPAKLTELSEGMTRGEHTTRQSLARLLISHETTDTGQLACASCHQEHQGATFDLTRMTNAQCQSCHSSSFHSFADGHPEFSERPRARLHFDHVTHMNLHFQSFERLMPGGKARMQCSDCHTLDAGGAMIELGSFDVMCASCHEPQIRDYDAAPHAQLHELVFLDRQTNPTDLPAGSPFMQLMLNDKAADPAAVDELLQDLSDDGEETLRRRLHMICDQSTDATMIEACVQAMEESHFFDAIGVFSESATTEPEERTYGNWRYMPEQQTLIYDCNQHADPVLETWITLLARNVKQYPEPPAADRSGSFDRFLRELAAPESTGRCLKCHSVEQMPDGGLTVHWETEHGRRSAHGFTRFSHQPHLTLLSSDTDVGVEGGRQRCETCHALDDSSFSLVNRAFQLDNGMPNPQRAGCSALGVDSLQRQSCAECHTQSLAGDNCLQCHNYHVHEDSF